MPALAEAGEVVSINDADLISVEGKNFDGRQVAEGYVLETSQVVVVQVDPFELGMASQFDLNWLLA